MLYGDVHFYPIEMFFSSRPGPPVPPSLWLRAEEDEDLPPLLARRSANGYEILSGLEIWKAAQLGFASRVPAILTDDPPDLSGLPAQSPYLQDAITEARAIDILKESHGLSDRELAEKIGWSRKQVSDYRRLLRLKPEVMELVRSGRLSVAKASELVSIPANRQHRLAQHACDLGMSLQDIREMARQWKIPRKPRDEGRNLAQPRHQGLPDGYNADPDIARLERLLEEQLGCRVRVDPEKRMLSISYHDNAVLDGVFNRLLSDDL